MNIIDFQNITVFQGRNKVLEDFSLTIDESQSTVILGPNGSGKTTLLKLLNRELYIVEDKVVALKSLKKTEWNVDELRSNLGVVSQHLQYGYSRVRLVYMLFFQAFIRVMVYGSTKNLMMRRLDRAKEVMDLCLYLTSRIESFLQCLQESKENSCLQGRLSMILPF